MRLAAAVLLLCGLAGCGDRRTFDERYEQTQDRLDAKARQLDENIANQAEPAGNSDASHR